MQKAGPPGRTGSEQRTSCGRARWGSPRLDRSREVGDVRQRETLPALMHEVQAFTRFGVPLTTVRTRWMFGFQRRDVRRCECEMLLPKPGPLPQTSQLAATGHSKYFR